SPAMVRASWRSTTRHPGMRITIMAPERCEDAATNNIGSVTVLHQRVHVQAEYEERRPDFLPFRVPSRAACLPSSPPSARRAKDARLTPALFPLVVALLTGHLHNWAGRNANYW